VLPTKVDNTKLFKLMVHALSVEMLMIFDCSEETKNVAELIALAETLWTILVLMSIVLAFILDNVILDT